MNYNKGYSNGKKLINMIRRKADTQSSLVLIILFWSGAWY